MSGSQESVLTIVVPVAEYQDVARVAARHAQRRGVKGMRAALLPAEKSSSPPFMRVLEQRMAGQTDVRRALLHNPDWPFFHPQRAALIPSEIDQLARECDLMVSGVAY